MDKKKFGIICLIAVLVASLAGCGKTDEKELPVPLVKYERASLGSNGSEASYAGSVRGRYETNMSFQVGGQILNRNVQVGQQVRAGDILMVIDAKDVVQKANQGDAQVEAARAQLALAQSNLKRYSQLYDEQAVSAAVLDQYQTAYDAAFASYQQALAGAAQGHNALSYTNLVAGADGVVSAVNAEAGQVVAAGQTVLTLVQSDELEVEIQMPENHLADVPLGKEVRVSFWALGKTEAAGIIREVSPMADSVTRTYRVRISIPQPPEGMQLGMTANVTCSHADGQISPDTVVLPLSAIYQTEDTPQVWIVDEDSHTLSLQAVSVEAFGDNQVKVKGLKDGDLVVTAGVHKLREGLKVRLSAGDAS